MLIVNDSLFHSILIIFIIHSDHHGHGTCTSSRQLQYWKKIKFFGTPLHSFFGGDLETCMQRCQTTSKCQIFNYYKSRFVKRCFLKANARGFRVHAGFAGGHKCNYQLPVSARPTFSLMTYPKI